jgi:hypothetical protein
VGNDVLFTATVSADERKRVMVPVPFDPMTFGGRSRSITSPEPSTVGTFVQ